MAGGVERGREADLLEIVDAKGGAIDECVRQRFDSDAGHVAELVTSARVGDKRLVKAFVLRLCVGDREEGVCHAGEYDGVGVGLAGRIERLLFAPLEPQWRGFACEDLKSRTTARSDGAAERMASDQARRVKVDAWNSDAIGGD